jgi:hypothetical protein
VVEGRGNLMRNNQVLDTTRTTVFGSSSDTFGLLVNGPGSRVINNDSTETMGSLTAYGIQLPRRTGRWWRNRVGNSSLASGSMAIALNSGHDGLVVGNRMATIENGIVWTPPDNARSHPTGAVSSSR